MATKRKTGTLAAAGKKVKTAAKAVAKKADEYVVEPVGKALGLTKKKAAPRKKAATTSAAKKTAKPATAKKKPAAKKGTAKGK